MKIQLNPSDGMHIKEINNKYKVFKRKSEIQFKDIFVPILSIEDAKIILVDKTYNEISVWRGKISSMNLETFEQFKDGWLVYINSLSMEEGVEENVTTILLKDTPRLLSDSAKIA